MAVDTLGEGDNHAFIYDRRGETELLALPDTSNVTWARRNSEIAAASVTIPAADCVADLDDVHGWANTLVIFRTVPGRPPERVYDGPVRKKQTVGQTMVITASDVVGYTERRAQVVPRILTSSPVVTEMDWCLDQAFAADDPNVLSFVQIVGGTGPSMSREINAETQYASEDLANIVGAGGRFTTVGRRTLLFADSTVLGRLPTLHPEIHMNAEVTITEDGDMLATRAIARDDQGVVGRSGGVDAYYGLVDRITSPGPGNHARIALTRYAQSTREQNYPTPIQIEIPDNARLACDSPYPMRRLVCGVLIPVEGLTATKRVIRASYTLTGVDVVQNAGQAETVSIQLAPISQAAVVV